MEESQNETSKEWSKYGKKSHQSPVIVILKKRIKSQLFFAGKDIALKLSHWCYKSFLLLIWSKALSDL
jgi:hypothetical protein